jgi:hypothetical protein
MKHVVLEPEVAGAWGPNTLADTSVHPPLVSRLHYEFDDWLGDELLESFPCFIVTARLGAELERARLTGFVLDDVEISVSENFEELDPDATLPPFRWLRISGEAGQADFGVASDQRLVVSDRALAILERFQLQNAERSPFGPST